MQYNISRNILHLAVTVYPPKGAGCPSAASNPEETNTTSGENS